MKRAILITGFNNWGKTTQIYGIFRRSRFYVGCTYSIPGVRAQFTVETHSNDDFGENRFVEVVKNRIAQSPVSEKDILCAFCPTREDYNDSLRILQGKPFSGFDEIHLLLLKYKWDFHAELKVQEIRHYLSPVKNVQFFVVDADAQPMTDSLRCHARENQIVSYLKGLYP
jgi:hypothetical protein